MYHFKFTNIKLIFFFKSRNKNVCFIFILLLILENCCCLGRLQHAWVHAALFGPTLTGQQKTRQKVWVAVNAPLLSCLPFVRCATQLVTTVGLLYLSLAASKRSTTMSGNLKISFKWVAKSTHTKELLSTFHIRFWTTIS